jgi:hypothetical protein
VSGAQHDGFIAKHPGAIAVAFAGRGEFFLATCACSIFCRHRWREKSRPRSASVQAIQPAGIRMVGQDLMGQIAGGLTAAQILRSRRAQDGRIVISGRMRDVCAELDRLCDESR